LKLIGIGLSTADIARRLERSVKTVEWHRVSLGEKLGVTNRVELARIAIAAGLVSLDEPVGGSAGE
jgi:DNA-binding NarL/FixJ family response regulator